MYAVVYPFQVHKAVIRETEEPVAIKVMTKARLGERALQMLAAEINILRTLQHREWKHDMAFAWSVPCGGGSMMR